MNFKKILLVFSTKAGSYDKKLEKKIVERFKQEGLIDKLELIRTNRKGHIVDVVGQFAKKYDKEGLVYIAGGDGSISEAANAIRGSQTCLGIIAMGTGNDFAKSIAYKWDDMLEHICNPSIRKIDLMDINDSTSLNVCSFGLDTLVLKNTLDILEKHKFLGKRAYLFGILKTLLKIPGYKLRYRFIDDKDQEVIGEGEYMLMAICNGSYYGSGFNPSPKSNLEDGIFELVLVKKFSLPKIARLLPKYKKGKHLGEEGVYIFRAKKAEFKFERPILGNIDGNLLEADEFILKGHSQINLAFYE
ncbi:lipid kinase, YegS/Rv2252/BmrU family [Clostridiales bacterium KA00134]|nr:lipid kinase, YegS/Rv2252/BmrU family [Clostridiales bacterium KA00134]